MVDTIYILARDEIANIDRCLRAIQSLGIPTTVLDSGSTDGTIDCVRGFDFVRVEHFDYHSHCQAYNQLTLSASADSTLIILDADMRIGQRYIDQVDTAFRESPETDAVVAPVQMYWNGRPLRHGSLYPPKTVALRGGRALFEPVGHGERLRTSAMTVTISAPITHDDRRPYEAEIRKQLSYADSFIARAQLDALTWRDRIRLRTSAALVLSPLISYVLRLGFLSGAVGRLYALDRLIAEALTRRAILAARMTANAGHARAIRR